MIPIIFTQIEALGGQVAVRNGSLREQLESIHFSVSLYDHEWGYHGFDEVLEKQKQAPKTKTVFERMADQYLLAGGDQPYGQNFWCANYFAPMTPGSVDYDEWAELINDPRYTNWSEIRKVVGEGPLEFIQIIYSYGYPDHYYICLNDPNPDNPMVFGTDHEVMFDEVTNYGPLESFLGTFWTRPQFIEVLSVAEEKLANESAAVEQWLADRKASRN